MANPWRTRIALAMSVGIVALTLAACGAGTSEPKAITWAAASLASPTKCPDLAILKPTATPVQQSTLSTSLFLYCSYRLKGGTATLAIYAKVPAIFNPTSSYSSTPPATLHQLRVSTEAAAHGSAVDEPALGPDAFNYVEYETYSGVKFASCAVYAPTVDGRIILVETDGFASFLKSIGAVSTAAMHKRCTEAIDSIRTTR